MSDTRRGSYLHGAAILAAAVVIVKVIGGIYKIPLYNLLGTEGTAHYTVAYNIYSLLFAIATAGLPVALSRMVSMASTQGRDKQLQRIFSLSRWTFFVIGLIGSAIMFAFPRQIAEIIGSQGNDASWYSIRALSPALALICVTAAYRGYFQGRNDMVPTSVSQMIEALCKLVFGLSAAWWLLRNGAQSPVVAAGAISGVSIGSALSLVYMLIYSRKHPFKKRLSGEVDVPDSRGKIMKTLLGIGVPITISASFMGLVTLLDTGIILERLQHGLGLSAAGANDLLGSYSMVQTLANLPSSIIIPITVSFVPSITAYIARGRYSDAAAVTESGLKITCLIAMPAGAGLSVLSNGIVGALYPAAGAEAAGILTYMGFSSILVCMMLMTNSILQSYGYERYTVYTAVIGGIIKVALNWVLVGTENIGIYGAAMASVFCYLIIVILNISVILSRIEPAPRIGHVIIRPVLCTAVMAVAARAVYSLAYGVLMSGNGGTLSGHMICILALAGAIIAAAAVYLVLIIAVGALTNEDVGMLPGGDKLANKLKIR